MQPDRRPPFDPDQAEALLGRLVLVGLTYVTPDGEVIERVQVKGVVVRCDPATVHIEQADGGELLTLPPDLRPFQPAPAGSYRLRSTGEVVLDPDYLATWTIRRPAVEEVADPLP